MNYSVHSSTWSKVQHFCLPFSCLGNTHLNQHSPFLSADKKLKMTNLKRGLQYEFRVAAVNAAGMGDASEPSQAVFARDSTSKCTDRHPAALGVHKAANVDW